MARTEEVEEEPVETPPESKLLGIIDYRSGILFGLALTLGATLWVCLMYEEEQRNRFLAIAFFNFVCLGVTWLMRKKL